MTRAARRLTVGLVTFALAVVGLRGAYGYWESYYQHRGFSVVRLLPGAHRGKRLRVVFFSPALGRTADYFVYLPPDYEPGRRRYPVYYLLHGSPGRPEVYFGIAGMATRMDNLISERRMGPMILVMPDGRIGGSAFSDSEWANTPAGNYESYVLDVVRDVDARFATIASRDDRVIAGFSAGAYGAAEIALHHLPVFANLQAWSGYFLQQRVGVFAHASRSQLAYDSPLDYVHRVARQLARYPLRAFLFCGRDDNDSVQLEPMAHALAAEGAEVSYALYPGGHDWQLWHAHLDQMLIGAWHDVLVPPRPGPGAARFLTPGVTPIPHGLGRHLRSGLAPAHGGPLVLRRPGASGRGRRLRHSALVPATSGGPGAPGPTASTRSAGAASTRSAHATSRAPAVGGRPRRHPLATTTLLAGLLLALISAALINLGFLLQHRGLGPQRQSGRGMLPTLWAALRNRTWLGGQAVGWVGFGTQTVAVAIAPLSLVQAFAAGGLALSVPLASAFFSHRLTRPQVAAVLVIAAGLAVLPIGFHGSLDRIHTPELWACAGVAVAVGLGLALVRAPAARSLAAGVFYGAADAAIKAVAVGGHGLWASAPVWAAVAALTTFAGFLAFQSALRCGSAVGAISLMNAFATLIALGCGLVAFGESLGAGTVAVAGHAVAIAAVLGGVPVLAAAQAELTEQPGEPSGRGSPSSPPRVPV